MQVLLSNTTYANTVDITVDQYVELVGCGRVVQMADDGWLSEWYRIKTCLHASCVCRVTMGTSSSQTIGTTLALFGERGESVGVFVELEL